MTENFNLLRLPLLAVYNCLECLDIFEIIDFSLLSRRSKSLVSSIIRKPIDIDVEIGEKPVISMFSSEYPGFEWSFDVENLEGFPITHRTFDGKPTPSLLYCHLNGGKVCYSLKLPQKEFQCVFRFLVELLTTIFRSAIRKFSIYGLNDQDTMEVLKWFKSVQSSIYYLNIDGDDISPTSEGFAHNNFEISQKFSFDNREKSSELQNVVVRNKKIFEMHTLILALSHWFSLDDILKATCTIMSFTESIITPVDLNYFLKKWLDGSNPNLVYFEVVRVMADGEDKDHIFNAITQDMAVREHIEDERRPMTLEIYGDDILQLNRHASFDIERRDGAIGTFLLDSSPGTGDSNVIEQYFSFHVWNKV